MEAYSKDEIIDEIQDVADEHGEPLSSRTFEDEASMGRVPVYRAFGSWKDACDEADVEPWERDTVGREEIISEIQRLDNEKDGPLVLQDFKDEASMSYTPLARIFGTWKKACEQAGVTPKGRKVSDEEYLRDIRRVADQVEGVLTGDYYDEHGEYSRGLADVRFGSWNEAKKEAGLPTLGGEAFLYDDGFAGFAADVGSDRKEEMNDLLDELQEVREDLKAWEGDSYASESFFRTKRKEALAALSRLERELMREREGYQ